MYIFTKYFFCLVILLIRSIQWNLELEIMDTTDRAISDSYLDLLTEIDDEGRLKTKLYGKRYEFNYLIVNFQFLCSNISAASAYGIYL